MMAITQADKEGADKSRPGPNRVAFVIAHLGPGGAQRALSVAANALAERGVDVHVITVLDDHPDTHDLWRMVRRHRRKTDDISLNHPGVEQAGRPNGRAERLASALINIAKRYDLLRRPLAAADFGVRLIRNARWLRRTLREIQPDAVLSFLTQTNILTLLATRGMKVRTLVSERNDPTLQHHHPHVTLMQRLLYPKSDLVTANTLGALEALEKFVPKRQLALLPNPLMLSDRKAINFMAPTFITVTRLVEQKGVDVLLKASAQAFARLPGWRLVIIGDGPLRSNLQELSNELGITKRVDWLGYVKDPTPFLRGAKFFVLTSRFEGSPNALLEALACGLPAIVSDASPGPLELVGDQKAGLIVPIGNIAATADAIVRLASDEALRRALGSAARERTRAHQLEPAMRVWLKLLQGS